MPTRYRRIQVTEDPELARALHEAAPHLPGDLPRSRQVRDLAIAGARQLTSGSMSEEERHRALERLAQSFEDADAGAIDPEVLRTSKSRAWRVP